MSALLPGRVIVGVPVGFIGFSRAQKTVKFHSELSSSVQVTLSPSTVPHPKSIRDPTLTPPRRPPKYIHS